MDAEANESPQQISNATREQKLSESSESGDIIGNLYTQENIGTPVTHREDGSQNSDKEELLKLGMDAISKEISRKKYEEKATSFISRMNDVNFSDETGKTPLHHATAMGKAELVKILLDKNADAQAKDVGNWTPLRISASRGNVECLKLILDKLKGTQSRDMDDIDLSLHEAAKKKSGTCVEELLKAGAKLDINAVVRVSNSAKILKERFDSYVKPNNVDPSEHFFKITFDYSALVTENRQMEVIEQMLTAEKDKRDELILHPLIESFIYFKWRKMCFYYGLHFFFYFVLNCFFTAFVMASLVPRNCTKTGPQIDRATNCSTANQQVDFVANTWLLSISGALLFPFVLKEIVEICFARSRYFLRLETLSEFTLIATMAILVYAVIPLNQHGYEILYPLVVVVLLRWIRLTIMCGTVGYFFGTYSLMFYVVAIRLMKLLIAFFFLFFGFVCTFYVVFNNSPAVNDAGIIVLIINMMISALDYEEFFHGEKTPVTLPVMAQVIYAVFLFLICLVLLNLFIALAVNDTKNLKKKGRAYQLCRKATAAIALEHFFTIKDSRLGRLLKLDKLHSRIQIDDKIKVNGNRQVLEPNTNKRDHNTNQVTTGQAPYTRVPINEDEQEEQHFFKKWTEWFKNVYLPKGIFEKALKKSYAK